LGPAGTSGTGDMGVDMDVDMPSIIAEWFVRTNAFG
jgi:hypothetical protein